MSIQRKFNEEKIITAGGFGKFIWYLSYILLIPIFISVSMRNRMLRYETKIDEADSGIDVQLTKRQEMLSKLIDTTRQTMKWEQETLTEVMRLRNIRPQSLNANEKAQLNQQIDNLQRQINFQMEAYPNLKSTDVVQNLQTGIRDVEDNLAAARRIYNSNVSAYNQYIQVYPQNVIASDAGKSTKVFFEATEQQRADVKIDLSF